MSFRTLYHRAFAVAVALSLWAYAIYCASLGRVFLPMRYGTRNVIAPMWSQDRYWMSLDGVGGYMLMAAMLIAGIGMFLLPAPAPTQEAWLKQAKREAMAKAMLLTGAGLVILGIVLQFGLSLASGPPAGQTLQQIQQAAQQDGLIRERFEATKGIWGLLSSVLLAGLLIDLFLRYRAGKAE
jgi:hypothetical protein